MGDTKEYIRGDKHVHQAGSVMIKIVQYNVPGQQGDRRQQEAEATKQQEQAFAEMEEVMDEVMDEVPAEGGAKPQTVVEVSPVDRFVNRVKAVVTEAAKKNGQTIATNTRAWQGEYVFFVDGHRIGRMMDDLRRNHEGKIMEFLQPYQKSDGVTVVAPFIGRLLDIEELRARDLQKSDLAFAFAPYYKNAPAAVKRMSDKLDSTEANMLIGLLQGLLRKHPRT